MQRKETKQKPGIDPVRIGGKRTALSLIVITAIAVVLLLIIRFTVL